MLFEDLSAQLLVTSLNHIYLEGLAFPFCPVDRTCAVALMLLQSKGRSHKRRSRPRSAVAEFLTGFMIIFVLGILFVRPT